MRVICLHDVETSPHDRIYRHSRMQSLLVAVVAVLAALALLVHSFNAEWTPGYYFAAAIGLFLALMHRFITACFRPSNWLVRMNEMGVFIQFRSYLNYHLPAEDKTVVFIPFHEKAL